MPYSSHLRLSRLSHQNSHSLFGLTATLALTCSALFPTGIEAAARSADPIVLMIGASYGNGSTPFNDALQAPLGGVSVNLGNYLSLGQALTADPLLGGKVINEAQAGATTFDRLGCGPASCGPAGFQGYDKQLQKALGRVAIPDAANPGQVLGYTASYLVITTPNDCLHSDAEGIPQSESLPCTAVQLNDLVTRLIGIGQTALAKGITPVYNIMPSYEDLDLQLSKQLFGFYWVIDEASYNHLQSLHADRIRNELPDALLVHGWRGFEHLGDGLHPTEPSARRAARRIAQAIKHHQSGQN